MTKLIFDRVSGKPVEINYSASVGVGTMCCGTKFIKKTMHPADKSMAGVAYSKGDLTAFGSFFETVDD